MRVAVALIRSSGRSPLHKEGEYSGLEHSAVPGKVVESLKIMTRAKSERIARFAFDFAVKNNRKVPSDAPPSTVDRMADIEHRE